MLKQKLTWYLTKGIHEKLQTEVKELTGVRPDNVFYFYLYTVHIVLTHATQNYKNNNYKGCPIHFDTLSALFSKTHKETSTILDNLQRWNILLKVKNYYKGDHSNCFTIHPDHSTDKLLREPITNDFNISFISKLMQREVMYNDEFCNESLKVLNDCITVNAEGIAYLTSVYGESFIELVSADFTSNDTEVKPTKYKPTEMPYRGCVINQCDYGLIQILGKQFNCTRPDKESRVYSNICNLPAIHRQYLSFNGNPLLMTDISNSQILLTVPLIKEEYKKYAGDSYYGMMPEDIRSFQALAETGRFYEQMAEWCGKVFNCNDDRQEFKASVFEKIWFSKNSKWLPLEKKVFKEHFPTVFNMITRLKQENYKNFSIGLQKFESSIIIGVAKKMMLQGYQVLTLHDSIVCCNMDTLLLAEELISNALLPHTIQPMFKRENTEEVKEVLQTVDINIVEDQTELIPEVEAIIKAHSLEPVIVERLDDIERGIFNIDGMMLTIMYYDEFKARTRHFNSSDIQILFEQIISTQSECNEVKINNTVLDFEKLVLAPQEIAICLN